MMAARQIEEIQKKLAVLNYPRANAPAPSLLFAGNEHYALLEWLFFRLLGDKSPFSQQNLQGDRIDRDEETARIQYFAEIAKFLDVQIQSIYPLYAPFTFGDKQHGLQETLIVLGRADVSELETKLSEQSKIFLNLQQKFNDLASKHSYNPDGDYTQVEAQLRAHLESFLETARAFNVIYAEEICPWTHMMEAPQLHGFGPAANRLLEAY